MVTGKMERLRECCHIIVKELNPVPVDFFLFSRGVLNLRDLQSVQSEKEPMKQTEKILHVLWAGGKLSPDATYQCFMDALEYAGYQQLKNVIERKAEPPESYLSLSLPSSRNNSFMIGPPSCNTSGYSSASSGFSRDPMEGEGLVWHKVHEAANEDDVRCMAREVMKHGDKVLKLRTEHGATPLTIAFDQQSKNVLHYICRRYRCEPEAEECLKTATLPTFDDQDKEGCTFLHRLVALVAPNAIGMLLEHGASIDIRNIHGRTPLQEAMFVRDRQAAIRPFCVFHTCLWLYEWLDENHFRKLNLIWNNSKHISGGKQMMNNNNNNVVPMQCETVLGEALEEALVKDDTEAVSLLIKSGVAIDSLDGHDHGNAQPMLHKAAAGLCDSDMLGRLLELGASVDQRDGDQNTALHVAVSWNNVDAVRTLLAAGADANAANNVKWTPLHLAAREASLEILQVLLDAGAKPMAADDCGKVPLHDAAVAGSVECVTALLDRGPSCVNAIAAKFGTTPLHDAVRGGNRGVVELLLNRGANRDLLSLNGETAHSLAVRKHGPESDIANLLRQ